jgi:hypothetical protein
MRPDIRYFAGFFDGEGCVYMTHRTENGHTYTYIRITAVNTYLPIIREIHREFGGHIYYDPWKNRPKNWSPTMSWIVNGTEAAALLRRMLPHLRVKRKAALAALKFHNRRKR